MAIKNPMSEKHMVKVSQDVFVAKKWSDPLKNVGVYNNPDRTSAGETTEDKYANWETKLIKKGDTMNIKVDLHEINPAIIDIIEYGAIKVSKEIESIVDRVEEFAPGQWSFTKDILLKSRNADKSVITPTEVKALVNGTWTKLVKDTDYSIGVNIIGDTWVKFIEWGVFTLDSPSVSSISIKYSATPDQTLEKIEHFDSALPIGFVMILEEKWKVNGKECGIRFKLDNCKNVKAFHKPISDGDNTTAGYPCDITGNVIGHEFFWFND